MSEVWAFDLDGTLIGSVLCDVLRPHAPELLGRLTDNGAICVLWSAGGADYARRRAEQHGISHYFTAYYDKDRRDLDSRYLVDHFAVEHRPRVFVDDSPRDLPVGGEVIAVSQFIGGNPHDGGLLSVLQRVQGVEAQ